MNSKKNEIDMLNGPLAGKILIFSLPLMATSLLQILFNAADTVVVGRFAGSDCLAAVGSTVTLVQLFVNTLMGLSVGTNVVVAQALGAGKEDKTRYGVHTGVFSSIVGGILIAILGAVTARMVLGLMGTPENVLGLATLYFRIIMLGLPFLSVYNVVAAILRAKGDTKRPLTYLLFSGVLNVILNLIFVILLHMNVAGVAWATVISQVVSCWLVVRCLMREEGAIQLHLKQLCFDARSFSRMMRIGIPAAIQGVVFSLSNIVIQGTVNSFGSVAVAGNSAGISLEGFVYVTMNAFSQAAQTFVGQNAGAKKLERVDWSAFLCVLMAAGFGLVLGNAVSLGGHFLCGIYATEEAVIRAGMSRLEVICAFYALCGMMDTMCGALRGLGKSVVPMICSLTGACLLRLLWIAFIFPLHPVLKFVYVSYPVTWTITLCMHLVYWTILRKKMNE